jgi:cytochrome c biogenesis protein CcmG/thiol:disulfide interchange protein DsbE
VIIAVLGVLIAGFLVLRPSSGSPGLAGKPAPDFTLITTNGSAIHLAALRGHPVLLNFWGVSCPPCRREVPLLQQAYARYRALGLIVLGVDAQGDGELAVRAFASERGVSYPMLLDPHGSAGPRYGVQDLPQSFFIDRNGVVREVDPSPFVEPGPLQQAIAKIL